MPTVTGVDQIVYAIMDEGTDIVGGATAPTYAAPKPIPGANTVNVESPTNRATHYSDNQASATAQQNGPKNISLAVDELTQEAMADILGMTVNDEGVLVESADDKAPFVAIGFRGLKADGTYQYHWYYKGQFGIPSENHETKGETPSFQTRTIEGQFIRRDYDKKVRVRADGSNDTFVGATTWFDEVYEEAPAV